MDSLERESYDLKKKKAQKPGCQTKQLMLTWTVAGQSGERAEFIKTSFFCDAKKETDILEKNEIIDRCTNKTDYQKALEIFTKIGETLGMGLKTIPEIRSLMLSDNLFFR